MEQTTRHSPEPRERPVRMVQESGRTIRRGEPRKPTEFGYTASMVDTPEDVLVSHQLCAGNPADLQTREAAIAGGSGDRHAGEDGAGRSRRRR
jgi:hypothetical protein